MQSTSVVTSPPPQPRNLHRSGSRSRSERPPPVSSQPTWRGGRDTARVQKRLSIPACRAFSPCPVWWEIWGSESSEERQNGKSSHPVKEIIRGDFPWGHTSWPVVITWKPPQHGNLGFVVGLFGIYLYLQVFSCNWLSKVRVLLIVSPIATPPPVSEQVDRPNRIADRPPSKKKNSQ